MILLMGGGVRETVNGLIPAGGGTIGLTFTQATRVGDDHISLG
jgi:hypothetical protein